MFAMITKLAVDGDDALRLVRLSCCNCQRRVHPCATEENPGNANAQPQWDENQANLFTCLTPDCPLSGQRFDPLDAEHIVVREFTWFIPSCVIMQQFEVFVQC